METSDATKRALQIVSDYDREKELKAFDDTKAGVKGLVDSGTVNIPRIFIRPPDELEEELTTYQTNFQVPVIDLDGVKENKLEEIIDQVRTASKTWGFFQVVNHGIPLNVLENMLHGIRKFNEQNLEMKKEFYSRDQKRKVKFYSNFDLYRSRTACWKDTLAICTTNNFLSSQLPEICRDTTMEYIKNVTKLGDSLFKLLSLALGLKPERLLEILGCNEVCSLRCHYYPPSPEPGLTFGTKRHSDATFLTILLQDRIGGLQVFHENQWVDVQHVSGGLVINIGDFLQVISNDKFQSVNHRVLSKSVDTRVSVACFLAGNVTVTSKLGPIEELTSEENPPIYRDFLPSEYYSTYAGVLSDKSVLHKFKL